MMDGEQPAGVETVRSCRGSARRMTGLFALLLFLTTIVSLANATAAGAGILRMAYVCGEHICTIRSDGEARRELTGTRGVQDQSPAWSPDANRMAFTRRETGDGFPSIYVWRRADSTFIRLRLGSHPAWSPDGRRIAYRGRRGINIMTRGGTILRSGLTDGEAPTWSPEGERLAFLKRVTYPCAGTPAPDNAPARGASPACRPDDKQLWTIATNGSDERPLREPVPGTEAPDWSPRREEIVLAYGPIAVLELLSGQVRTIADGADPAWSPGGGHLTFTTDPFDDPRVMVTDRDGGDRRTVTRGRDSDWRPEP